MPLLIRSREVARRAGAHRLRLTPVVPAVPPVVVERLRYADTVLVLGEEHERCPWCTFHMTPEVVRLSGGGLLRPLFLCANPRCLERAKAKHRLP